MKYSRKVLDKLNSITDKRPATVIQHILKNEFITTEELENDYGYKHPPRAIRDVRERGINIETYRVKSSDGRTIGAYRFGDPILTENSTAKVAGRTFLSHALKKALVDKYGSICFQFTVQQIKQADQEDFYFRKKRSLLLIGYSIFGNKKIISYVYRNKKTDIMTENECKETLSKTLFLDIDKDKFDMQLHSKYIIQRVLEYGNINDWRIIRSFYGLPAIVKACKQMRSLDAVCLAFICTISNTSKEDYRCYRIKQLNHTLWNS